MFLFFLSMLIVTGSLESLFCICMSCLYVVNWSGYASSKGKIWQETWQSNHQSHTLDNDFLRQLQCLLSCHSDLKLHWKFSLISSTLGGFLIPLSLVESQTFVAHQPPYGDGRQFVYCICHLVNQRNTIGQNMLTDTCTSGLPDLP